MSDRTRFLDAKAFGALLADLRLTPNVFQDRLLEFMERAGLVRPAARIDWPRSIIVEGRGGTPTPPPTDIERASTTNLSNALKRWRRYDADPSLPHPLDADLATPEGMLITRTFKPETFRPWSAFSTTITGVRSQPFEVPDAVDTYYHAWQALLVADALEMGVRIIFDTRDPNLMGLAMAGDLADLPQDKAYHQVSFEGPRGLRDGETWAAYFDVAAKLEVARTRKINAFARAHEGDIFRLEAAQRQALTAFQTAIAKTELSAINADQNKVLAFIRYLCTRWNDKTRRGQGEIAAEYKRQVELAARLAMAAYDMSFEDLAPAVGRATTHFANTLDVMFPDWTQEARERAELSLKVAVVANAPAAVPELTLSDADAGDLLDWLERNDQWRVHLAIETMLKHQFSDTAIDHAALAKEVEALATTLEHLVNALLREAGCSDSDPLMKKLRRYWKQVPDVNALLDAGKQFVGGQTCLADQLAAITALGAAEPNRAVAQTLLRAVLYRNAGQHAGMASFSEEELQEVARIMLTAMLLCRKNLLVYPPTP